MRKALVSRLLSFIQDGRGFFLGLVFGVMLTVTGTALSQDDEKALGFVKVLLRAVAELAINTETNAVNIVALHDRLNDLELMVDEIAEDKK